MKSTQTTTIDEKELEKIVKKVLEENKKAVDDYRKGKEAALMYLVGQVMRELKAKIDTKKARDEIVKELKHG